MHNPSDTKAKDFSFPELVTDEHEEESIDSLERSQALFFKTFKEVVQIEEKLTILTPDVGNVKVIFSIPVYFQEFANGMLIQTLESLFNQELEEGDAIEVNLIVNLLKSKKYIQNIKHYPSQSEDTFFRLGEKPVGYIGKDGDYPTDLVESDQMMSFLTLLFRIQELAREDNKKEVVKIISEIEQKELKRLAFLAAAEANKVKLSVIDTTRADLSSTGTGLGYKTEELCGLKAIRTIGADYVTSRKDKYPPEAVFRLWDIDTTCNKNFAADTINTYALHPDLCYSSSPLILIPVSEGKFDIEYFAGFMSRYVNGSGSPQITVRVETLDQKLDSNITGRSIGMAYYNHEDDGTFAMLKDLDFNENNPNLGSLNLRMLPWDNISISSIREDGYMDGCAHLDAFNREKFDIFIQTQKGASRSPDNILEKILGGVENRESINHEYLNLVEIYSDYFFKQRFVDRNFLPSLNFDYEALSIVISLMAQYVALHRIIVQYNLWVKTMSPNILTNPNTVNYGQITDQLYPTQPFLDKDERHRRLLAAMNIDIFSQKSKSLSNIWAQKKRQK